MTYKVRTFSEEFIDKQVEIGNKAYEGWIGAGQTSVNNLKNSYNSENNPNFDPETKFYVFKEDEMVGFLPANLQPKKGR